MKAIGVDIGGSHISCAACELSEKKYLADTHSESELDNQGTPDEIISAWARTLEETFRKTGRKSIKGIGFAMPGPFDYVNGIALFKGNNKKYENIYGLNVTDVLRKKMKLKEDITIRFINDAAAFAMGEDWLGMAAGTRKSLSITLGTGFGSAFLNNHVPVVTGNQVPEMGTLWHLPFKTGSADDYFSTRGLLNRYQEKTGRTLSGVKLLAGLATTEPLVKQLFDDFGLNLGMFLHDWIKRSGIEALIIGGNIANTFNLFGNSLKKYFESNGINIRISVSELKETASIIGSAILADDDFYKKILPVLKHM